MASPAKPQPRCTAAFAVPLPPSSLRNDFTAISMTTMVTNFYIQYTRQLPLMIEPPRMHSFKTWWFTEAGRQKIVKGCDCCWDLRGASPNLPNMVPSFSVPRWIVAFNFRNFIKTDKDRFKIKTCFLSVQTDFALRLALPFPVCKVGGSQTHLLYHHVQRHMTRMSDEHRWTRKACSIREPLKVRSSSSVEHVPTYHVFLGPSMNS
jgi:hypothetical protein